MKLELIHRGTLYRNPHPGHEAIAAIYPFILPINDQELLCLYRRGQALYSLDGMVHQLRSLDGGYTWQEEGPIIPADFAAGHTFGTTWMTRHSDGTIFHQGLCYRADRDTMIRFHPETGGHRPDEQYLMHSKDNGRTWSKPAVYDISRQRIADTHCAVHETSDGRWMQIFETWHHFDEPGPLHIKNFTQFSNDKGRTWSNPQFLPGSSDTRLMYSHSQFVKLSDGRFCATQWTQDVGGQVNHGLYLTFGDAKGNTWTQPRATGLRGQSSCVGEVRPGTLVVTYTCREGDHPGIYVALSEDGGKTFNQARQVNVWDAAGRSMLGEIHPDRYPASHDNQAFGKPDTAVLPCGDILSSWWCTHDSVTQVRFARLRVMD